MLQVRRVGVGRWLTLLGLAVLTSILVIASSVGERAGAAQPAGVGIELGPDTPLPPKPRYSKLDSSLNRALDSPERINVSPQNPLPLSGLGPSVAVTIRTLGSTRDLEDLLRQGGAVLANAGEGYIEAYVPVSLLPALAERPEITRVQTIIPPQPLATSQGTTVHRSNIWNQGGFTGAGVKVGVIDVGFQGIRNLTGSELPSSIQAQCYTNIGQSSSNIADCDKDDKHGTAVAEAVVDMAPGVSLYIANPRSAGDLLNTANWMVGQGVKVINHSVGWEWQGPGDGTSIYSNSALAALNTAVSGGALWVNAAGNQATRTWTGPFSDQDSDAWHSFSGADETQDVALKAGDEFSVQLRWEDSWPGAATDLDVVLYDNSTPPQVVASSTDRQNGGVGSIPWEGLVFTASAGTYRVAVKFVSGPIPDWLQFQSFQGPGLEYSVATRSIANPAESANAGMLAVGAARWSSTSTIESFSSQGPTTDGRIKPDIVGADGGDSGSKGAWYGTSQASPHVAGLAALVLQRFPTKTPAEVATYLKNNALPRGSPVPNNTWGHGFAYLPSLPPGAPTNVVAVKGDKQATVTWTAPSFDGGGAITGYTATSSPGGQTKTVSGSDTTATVTGLTNGTSYTFTVVAANGAGTSPASAASNAVVPEVAPTPTPAPTATATPIPTPALGTTERISVSTAGAQANNDSWNPSISSTGRYVTFWSRATNLMSGDTAVAHAFIRDRYTGTTERLAPSYAVTPTDYTGGGAPVMSADGRFVAFTSGSQVVVYDKQSAGIPETISVSTSGVLGSNWSRYPAISADGRFVAFSSDAANLVAGDTNNWSDIFVRDRQLGTTERVSISTTGAQTNGYGQYPSISADGRFVAFSSTAADLVPGDTNNADDIFVRDRQMGTTQLISVSGTGVQGGNSSWAPVMSSDGRFVAFSSQASNLVNGDSNGARDVFVRDHSTGVTERVSISSGSVQGNGDSYNAAISSDGRFVAFHSSASNLVPGDTNNAFDVFLRDRLTGTTQRVSLSTGGTEANGNSSFPAISSDGQLVAFGSQATNLVSDDSNGFYATFVRDRAAVDTAASPTPTVTATATATPTATPTGTPAPTPTPNPEAPPAFLLKWGSDATSDGSFNRPYGIAKDGSGNIYVSDYYNHRIQKFDSNGTFLAKWGSYGSADGQFKYPQSIAVDGSGNVYVADSNNDRIQKFSSSGAFLAKWGTSGTADGQFTYPRGLALDSSGNVYVGDTNNHRIQKFTSSGSFLAKWGASGSGDGQFAYPYGIAVDASGNVYVADTNNHRVQKFSSGGAFVAKWGSQGTASGQFQYPRNVALDASGNVYVSDYLNHRIQKFNPAGAFQATWGSEGGGDGQLNSPMGLMVDGSGNIYVADALNHRIQKLSATGAYLAKWGSEVTGNGQLNMPQGVAVDPSGNVFVVDTYNHRIQKFTSAGAFASAWGSYGTGNGQFKYPTDVSTDASGNIYVVDSGNHRIQKFNASGAFVSAFGAYGTADGQLYAPADVAVDGLGNIYVAETGNNRIQKFNAAGSFLAKWGTYGSSDGQLNRPMGVVVDDSGNVYVSDSSNHRIQKFTSNGAFVTKWGSLGSGDGQFLFPYGIALDSQGNVYVVDSTNSRIQKFTSGGAFLAKWGEFGTGDGQFRTPFSVAADTSGNVYVTDMNNHRVQKFGPSTVPMPTPTPTPGPAVTPTPVPPLLPAFMFKWGSQGTGDGQFNYPHGVALDASGNVYVADSNNSRMQKFTSSGVFVAKWGSLGNGDGEFGSPHGVAVDSSGNVYVADYSSNRIQKFTSSGGFLTKWGSFGSGDGQFSSPGGVAADASGNVYVADTFNHRIQKFTPSGTFVTKWGSDGSSDGQFNSPQSVAVDAAGNVYVADSSGNSRIQKFTSNGTFLAQWGSYGTGDGQFKYPVGVAVDGSSNVYVADTSNNRIQKFTSTGGFLSKWGGFGSGDGQFHNPNGVAVDWSGNAYIADTINNRIQKFGPSTAPTPTPVPTPTPSSTPSPTATSTPTASPTPTPTATPAPTPTPTPTPKPTATPTATPTPTPTPTSPTVSQSISQALELVGTQKKVWVTLRAEGGLINGQAASLEGGIRHIEASLTYNPACMTVLAAKGTAPFTATSAATINPTDGTVALTVDIPVGTNAAQAPAEFGRLLVRLTGSSANLCDLTLKDDSTYRPGTEQGDPVWSGSSDVIKQYRRGDGRGTGVVTSVTQAIAMLRFLVASDSNAALGNINAVNAASVKSDAPLSGTDNGDHVSTADAILILRRLVKIVDDSFNPCAGSCN